MRDAMFTHADAETRLGKRDRRKIANNTYLHRLIDGDIGVRLHDTDVLVYSKVDGGVTLDTGGWRTVTTKDRLNRFGPLRVSSERGVWYVSSGDEANVPYLDGVRFLDGAIVGGGDKAEIARIQGLRKAIAKYADKYVKTLSAGDLKEPGPGDCWFCSMFQGVSGSDHIKSHIEEDYFVPSLLVRAFENAPHSQTMQWWAYQWWGDNERMAFLDESARVKKMLVKYLTHELGI